MALKLLLLLMFFLAASTSLLPSSGNHSLGILLMKASSMNSGFSAFHFHQFLFTQTLTCSPY